MQGARKRAASLGGKLGWRPRGGGRVHGEFAPNDELALYNDFEKKGLLSLLNLPLVWGLPLLYLPSPLCGIIAIVALVVLLAIIIVVRLAVIIVVIIRRFPYIAMAIALGVAVPNKAAVATLHQPLGLPPFFRAVDDNSVFHFIYIGCLVMLSSVGVIVLNLVSVSVFPQQSTSFEKRQTNKAQTAPPIIKPVQTSSVIKSVR